MKPFRAPFLHLPSIRLAAFTLAAALLLPGALFASQLNGGGYTIMAWNDLGMHCMDDDFSIFSLLPPFNTINAHLIDSEGRLVTSASGITLTYRAVADPDGSINTSSATKTNYWDYVTALYGAAVGPDEGLTGFHMPGTANEPRAMAFDPAFDWWIATGIPLTPIDDDGHPNSYPMMEVAAHSAGGSLLASTRIVLPVSSEMDCRACHGSGTAQPGAPLPSALPSAGWEYDSDPVRDYRLNVLRIHDEREAGNPAFAAALAAKGYSSAGLWDSAVNQATPVLCAACHASNALPGTGVPGVSALTNALHTRHAAVINPDDGLSMNSSVSRTSCYQCHPGSDTRCLRGAMGASVATDGSLSMQCQNCHGSMSDVGAATRTGWLQEPACQSCHAGTATNNPGQIRYTSVFESLGVERDPTDARFATNADTPAPGFSLYRFSRGHGGLQCSACHGSTHAIFPSSHRNDNLQSLQIQGHAGTLADCTACHKEDPESSSGGPHGMHSIGAKWARDHGGAAEANNSAACKVCHGTDFKGTVLSRALGDRSFTTEFGTVTFFKGATVSCYACHGGPNSEHISSNRPPLVTDRVLDTPVDIPAALALSGTDPDGDPLSFRVVNQPAWGTVGVSPTGLATYYPFAGFAGYDYFTYAAGDGEEDSNLGIVSVTVGSPTLTTDSDGDGTPDFTEYVLGLSPFSPSSSGPRIELDASGHLTATLSRCCTPPDARIDIEVSGDLTLWQSGAPYTEVVNETLTTLEIRDTLGTGTGADRFMRLKTTRN